MVDIGTSVEELKSAAVRPRRGEGAAVDRLPPSCRHGRVYRLRHVAPCDVAACAAVTGVGRIELMRLSTIGVSMKR